MSKKLFLPITLLIILLGGAAWLFVFDRDNESQQGDIAVKSSEPSIKIIAFGDSLTDGYGLLESEAYPAQLEAALLTKGYDAEVINAGVSGETTRGNLERASFIAAQAPAIVLLGVGGNDALRALPLIETRKNILETIAVLQNAESEPVIILLQMQAPLNAGFAYKQEFDLIYESIAAEKGVILVPFITPELFLDSTNKLPDGIHYNKTGYQKVVEQYVLPATIEVLDSIEKGGQE